MNPPPRQGGTEKSDFMILLPLLVFLDPLIAKQEKVVSVPPGLRGGLIFMRETTL
jgi:hypothetical protein